MRPECISRGGRRRNRRDGGQRRTVGQDWVSSGTLSRSRKFREVTRSGVVVGRSLSDLRR